MNLNDAHNLGKELGGAGLTQEQAEYVALGQSFWMHNKPRARRWRNLVARQIMMGWASESMMREYAESGCDESKFMTAEEQFYHYGLDKYCDFPHGYFPRRMR